jgi:perosamine synthetase
MSSKQKHASDFRYNTGNAAVPWDAVAVKPDQGLLMDVIRFLVQPGSDSAAYERAASEVHDAVAKLFANGTPATKLSLGDKVKAVEARACADLGTQYASFLVNWTAGYDIALDMAGVQPGDEVIIPAITFIATASPIIRKGAKVVFADVQRETVNMDPEDVARKITAKTRAIVPVHLGGYPVDMDPIMELARENGITVIEDAAHAYGGHYKGTPLGAIGDFGAFSFHEVKNITSLGEGGILCTNNELGRQFPMARFCGFDLQSPPPENWLYNIAPIKTATGGIFAAGNFSTTEIQAVGLLRQMAMNADIITIRRKVARRLDAAFRDIDGLIPAPLDDDAYGATFHLYLLRVDPDKVPGGVMPFKKQLADRGITQIAHFCPLYRYDLFKAMGYDVAAEAAGCPNANRVFDHEYTHLPLYPLNDTQIDTMINAVRESVAALQESA